MVMVNKQTIPNVLTPFHHKQFNNNVSEKKKSEDNWKKLDPVDGFFSFSIQSETGVARKLNDLVRLPTASKNISAKIFAKHCTTSIERSWRHYSRPVSISRSVEEMKLKIRNTPSKRDSLQSALSLRSHSAVCVFITS